MHLLRRPATTPAPAARFKLSAVAIGSGAFLVALLNYWVLRVWSAIALWNLTDFSLPWWSAFSTANLVAALTMTGASAFLSAQLAREAPFRHALLVGLFSELMFLGLVGAYHGSLPSWYLIARVTLTVPVALVGALLSHAQKLATQPKV
ncbi:hypothetical protein [Gloeobacter kilaueensis]|uniref:Uncharacterized protein n=1 Tax=Gloeobacter kilaueensis (strain ATCC BAA-2537 / CCAP 1431/1 / ULC 316 / JS1) TaxID=1183438 RepID=U5QFF3_GLOK1|nr:hypothetical protein [Gloeobacter kilaueensis]AGY56400.1 hypothetical protein GKIL_0153 [Gloeobacter kilaueensis JS1]